MEKEIYDRVSYLVKEGLERVDPHELSATQIKDLAKLIDNEGERGEDVRPFEGLSFEELMKLANDE